MVYGIGLTWYLSPTVLRTAWPQGPSPALATQVVGKLYGRSHFGDILSRVKCTRIPVQMLLERNHGEMYLIYSFFWVPNIWGISYWGDGMELISWYQLLLNHTKPIYTVLLLLLLVWMPTITSYNVQFFHWFFSPFSGADGRRDLQLPSNGTVAQGEAPRFPWGPIAWKIPSGKLT